jgi:hypothetical protein
MSSLFPSLTQFPRNSFDPSLDAAAPAPAEQQRGLLRLLFDALVESRQREAEQRSPALSSAPVASSPTDARPSASQP